MAQRSLSPSWRCRAPAMGALCWCTLAAGGFWQSSFATQGAESVCELSAVAVLVLERGDKCKNRKIVISREGRHISE